MKAYTSFAALLVLVLGISACGASQNGGGPPNGEQLYAQRCLPCHSTGTDKKVGPGLADLFSPGGPTLPAGVDYGGKLPNGAAINDANVAAWVREGGRGQIGMMPGMKMSDEEMAALIAYMKTLE
jgi:cytochrome c